MLVAVLGAVFDKGVAAQLRTQSDMRRKRGTLHLGALRRVDRQRQVFLTARQQPADDAGRSFFCGGPIEFLRLAEASQHKAGGLYARRRKDFENLPRLTFEPARLNSALDSAARRPIDIGRGAGQRDAFYDAQSESPGPVRRRGGEG